MPIFDDKDNVVIGGKKKGRGRPKGSKNPKTPVKSKKVKTQFTFYEYLVDRFNLSYIAGMFKEASATILEWDLMVTNLSSLLQHKLESEV